jgi:hypothetical protein
MTSFFWFQYKPADERETAILSKARWHALQATWSVLSVMLAVLLVLSPDKQIPVWVALVAVFVVEWLGFVVGWWVIRRETFEGVSVKLNRWLGLDHLLLQVVFGGAIAVIVLSQAPGLYYPVVALWHVFTVGLLWIWAWKSFVHCEWPVRLLMTIFAIVTLPYSRATKRSVLMRICIAIGFTIFWIIMTTIPIVLVRSTSVEPIYVTTNEFVSYGFEHNHFYLVDKQARTFVKTGDVALVVRADGKQVIRVFQEEQEPGSFVVGRMLATYPGQSWLDALGAESY